MNYIRNASTVNAINKMKKAKRDFYNFEEALARVRWVQAGMLSEQLLDYITDKWLTKTR